MLAKLTDWVGLGFELEFGELYTNYYNADGIKSNENEYNVFVLWNKKRTPLKESV